MENTISIQKLPKHADVAALCEAFGKFGRILSASIVCDKHNESLGKAEITFGDYNSAQNSIKHMNGKKIMNKAVFVTLQADSQKFYKVFVKNLDKEWDEAEVLRVFSAVGPVEGVYLSFNDAGESNGYGHVKFQNSADAQEAVKYFNNRKVNGQELFVERFKNATERLNYTQNSIEYAENLLKNSTQKDNLHVKNLPQDMGDGDLKHYFQRYGAVTSCKVEYNEEGKSRGFGFVCFESMEAASQAQRKTNGAILNGKRLEVNFKQDGFARQHYFNLKKKNSELKASSYKQRSKSSSALQFHPHPLLHPHTLMKI